MRRFTGTIAVLAVCSLWPRLADAQPREDEATESSSAATPELREEVRVRFARGTQLYDEGEYRLALIEFERAYTLIPSYRILYNIGQVQQQLSQFAKALASLERYLAEGEGKIPDDRRAAVERDIQVLRTRVAKLTIHADAKAEVNVDGVTLSLPIEERLVDAGEHRITVSKRGYRSESRVLVLASGDSAVARFSLVQEQAPIARPIATPSSTPAWVAWTTTGALAAGSAVFGALALQSKSDLDGLRTRLGTTEQARQDVASEMSVRSTVADALGVGALVAAGVALYFTIKPPMRAPARTGLNGFTVSF